MFNIKLLILKNNLFWNRKLKIAMYKCITTYTLSYKRTENKIPLKLEKFWAKQNAKFLYEASKIK